MYENHSHRDAVHIDKETDRFLKAKEYVFKREWENAKVRLESYLERYPSGHYCDEALYWLAQSMKKLGKEQLSVEQLIFYKERAIQNLNQLVAAYKESLWLDDALRMKQELAGELALIGNREHQKYLEEVIADQKVSGSDLKLNALELLDDLRPSVSIPLFKKIMNMERDPVIRKRGLIMMGWKFPEETLAILGEVAEKDPDQAVREEAAYLVERIEMENIPVHLNYICCGARLKEPKDFSLIPENRITLFDIPQSDPKSKKSIKKNISKLFNKRLSDLTFADWSFSDMRPRYPFVIEKTGSDKVKIGRIVGENIKQSIFFDIHEGLKKKLNFYMTLFDDHGLLGISYSIHTFQIMLLGEGYLKEYDQISGQAMFYDMEKEKDYKSAFMVDEFNDKLLAIRKGDKVAMLILQFESEEDDDGTDEKIVYYTRFNNIMGCTVHSSRQNWNALEMGNLKGMIDFSQARVDIPGEKGRWRLLGNILSDGKNKRFIGRNAVLTDPRRKVTIEAAQIIVPADAPEKYEVIGKK